jgi:DNA polymerase (family X)
VGEPDNAALAERLASFAALLELAGANAYSARAYRRAAELIRATPADVSALVRAGRARELAGIGPGIEARLRELVETGEIAELTELERDLRPELVGFGRLLGLGARRTLELAEAVGARTADELREAIATGRVRDAPGVGPKTEDRLRAALAAERPRPRQALLLSRSLELCESIAAQLGGAVAGDARRMCDECERLAVVASSGALERFGGLPEIVAVVERGDGRAVGVTVEGVPVELVVAERERFGTELVRATGSDAYIAALEPLPDGPDEASVYRGLDVPLCPPELREAPFRGEPPPLVQLADLRGDLHVHTTWSDGRATVLEMGRAARDLGYEYVAICDHTRSVRVVPGLDAYDVRRQADEIAAANEELAPFRVLRGIECDILADGSLDLPDDVLAELDWVQASIHAGQRQSRDQLTRRTVEAMLHPAVRAISHPQGRIVGRRPPNAVDLDGVFEVAVETGTALEVNGLPDRLDLDGARVREAIAAGARIVTSTDAHSVRGLANMRYAVGTARRGWTTALDVVNTRPLEELLGG